MSGLPQKTLSRSKRWALGVCMALVTISVQAMTGVATADPATALQARYVAMRGALAASPFGRPLQLDSRDSPARLEGDVHALVEYPFDALRVAVKDPSSWCEILSLHVNVKRCLAAAGAPSRVTAFVGRKYDEPAEAVHRLDLTHQVDAEAADYIRVVLDAGAGPIGTRDYRIMLEAIPVAPGATFVHLSYAYSYSPIAALAMRAYLAAAGAGKVGFTVVDRRTDGKPVRVSGVRGALERNTMRCFLALDAFLGARAAPIAEQREKELLNWFAATERYPEQLHEVSLDEYLALKRR